MTQLLSSQGVDITQRNFQQIMIRGDGKDPFNQIINQEISVLPPSKNLEVIINDKFMFAKNSFDQWSLIYLVEHSYCVCLAPLGGGGVGKNATWWRQQNEACLEKQSIDWNCYCVVGNESFLDWRGFFF